MNYQTTAQDTSCLPEPLTRRNSTGEIYQRHPIVQTQIQEALRLPPEDLRRRSEITDKTSPEFLKEECLVYLIRHYRKAKNQPCVNELSEYLVRRCGTWINRKLRSLGQEMAIEGYSDVLERMFKQILDLDSDRGDFLQVRFWLALESLRIQSYRKQFSKLKLERDNIPLTSLAGYDGEDTDAPARKRAIQVPGTLARTVESEVIENDLIREALTRIEEPFRSAFLLRYYYGWPIEDQDPAVRTISRHFNKTPRTIRNWLAKAEKCLAAWRGEQK